jgi:hypothetical protein
MITPLFERRDHEEHDEPRPTGHPGGHEEHEANIIIVSIVVLGVHCATLFK